MFACRTYYVPLSDVHAPRGRYNCDYFGNSCRDNRPTSRDKIVFAQNRILKEIRLSLIPIINAIVTSMYRI